MCGEIYSGFLPRIRRLAREFYRRDPEALARELLGKLLVRRLGDRVVGGMIVETEAYLGADDPASRAYKGRLTKISRVMFEEGGTVLVYMVHGRWLLNIVAGPPGIPGAVLIRAVEPLIGIDVMAANRGTSDVTRLCSGPGRLCEAMRIDGGLTGERVYDPSSPIAVFDFRSVGDELVGRSGRIGVKRDLERPLRFYLRWSPFVSRHPSRLSSP